MTLRASLTPRAHSDSALSSGASWARLTADPQRFQFPHMSNTASSLQSPEGPFLTMAPLPLHSGSPSQAAIEVEAHREELPSTGTESPFSPQLSAQLTFVPAFRLVRFLL